MLLYDRPARPPPPPSPATAPPRRRLTSRSRLPQKPLQTKLSFHPITSMASKTLTLEDLKTVGQQLLTSRSHVNNLPILLSFISPSIPADLVFESLISLQSFFVPLVPEIPPSSKFKAGKEEKDPESVYKAWLRAKFDEFLNSLISIAVSPQTSDVLRDVALDAIMDFVKLGRKGRFQSAIYHRFLHNVVRAISSADILLDLLAEKYFKYIDVCYFTYTSMGKIAKTFEPTKTDESGKEDLYGGELSEPSKMKLDIHIIYNTLARIPLPILADKETSYEMWSQLGLSSKEVGKVPSKVLIADAMPERSKIKNNDVLSTGHISKKLKLKFTKAWISFLQLPLPLDVYKEVLGTLHQNVIPYMANPAILCDFLTRSYDIGGVISVMALSGLFILMTQYGVEYPKFYEKLYALLTADVFLAKHRASFFRLSDTCLRSSYLPAYLAAAFAKKLSRLALSVQPSGALVIIAIIHNLLLTHPSINFLIHQVIGEETDGDASMGRDDRDPDGGTVLHSKKLCADPFNSEEVDPAKSGAMRSSLWEINTLRHHYCPAVSRFVESLESDLMVRGKTSKVAVEDFSSGSYSTVFRDETRRRIKQVPLAFYRTIPSSLFMESEFDGWSFGDQHGGKETLIEDHGVMNSVGSADMIPMKRQRVDAS